MGLRALSPLVPASICGRESPVERRAVGGRGYESSQVGITARSRVASAAVRVRASLRLLAPRRRLRGACPPAEKGTRWLQRRIIPCSASATATTTTIIITRSLARRRASRGGLDTRWWRRARGATSDGPSAPRGLVAARRALQWCRMPPRGGARPWPPRVRAACRVEGGVGAG
eukprot:scaffold1318_cov388-Prasinococcus_capsulatus_cf.AAC.35